MTGSAYKVFTMEEEKYLTSNFSSPRSQGRVFSRLKTPGATPGALSAATVAAAAFVF